MDYENLSKRQIKKLQSIEDRLKALNQEVRDMGFNIYLANCNVNIMQGDSHDDRGKPLYQNVRHNFNLIGWSGGDW